MAISYAQTVLPRPYVILGIKLKPFCIGHYLNMANHGCSIALGGKDDFLTMKDLLLALFICHHSYEDFLDIMDGYRIFYPFGYRIRIRSNNYFTRFARKWGKAVHRHMQRNKEFNLLEHYGLFKKYMNEGCEMPPHWNEDEDEGRKGGGSWIQAVTMTMKGKCGYSETEALNFPQARTLADFTKHLESKGLVTMWTEQEIAAWEAKQREKEMAKAD